MILTFDEKCIVDILRKNSREDTISEICHTLDNFRDEDDQEMKKLLTETAEKLEKMKDTEFETAMEYPDF